MKNYSKRLAPQDKALAPGGKHDTGPMTYSNDADAIYIIRHQCMYTYGGLRHRAAVFGSPFFSSHRTAL